MAEPIHVKILEEFIIGGILVALALAVGSIAGPVFGGLVAALPIRLGATLLIGGVKEGSGFAFKMVEGSFLTYFGTFAFIAILLFGIPRIGLMRSFIAAAIANAVIVLILFKLAGKI